jgi:iron-sulfur cluster assembly accessory protein
VIVTNSLHARTDDARFRWYDSTMISLSERAAEKVRELLADEADAETLRVAVQGGGCSGFQYALGFDGAPQAGDEIVEMHGVVVIVDRFSLPYLEGASVDYVDGLMGQGFTVENPNAAASCGCGQSFQAEGGEPAGASAGGCGSGCSH